MAPADARDERGNPYELKSATKGGVTTARDVGLHTIANWRTKYWILAAGENLATGFEMDALYIAHPEDLEPWFAGIEARLRDAWSICEEVVEAALNAGVSADRIEVVRAICRRGITINNPKIPLWLIRQNATPLDHETAAVAQSQIRDFVTCRPLTSGQ